MTEVTENPLFLLLKWREARKKIKIKYRINSAESRD